MVTSPTLEPPRGPDAAAPPRLLVLGLYLSLAVIFLWIGAMKFTDYEAAGIAGLVMNSPLVGWWHALLGIKGTALMLGVVEIAAGLLLAARVFSARLAVVGAGMSVVTFFITLSFFVTTPGISEPLAGGFPAISAFPGQFLLKDLVLLAVSAYCLAESLHASRIANRPSPQER